MYILKYKKTSLMNAVTFATHDTVDGLRTNKYEVSVH
mgnify:CR=1 FL=1